MINHINGEKEAVEMLQRRGFTRRQITKLCHLRQSYGQDWQDQPALDKYRLEFVRFLVQTGRLTDQQ